MWKLIKHEFRRSRTAMLSLLGVAGALELYFITALFFMEEHSEHLVISVVLLGIAAYAALLFVLIRGVTSYSGELKAPSAKLLFMTPHSAYKIIASKYLYTILNALLMMAICVALTVMDAILMMGKEDGWNEMLGFLGRMLGMQGINVAQIGLGILFYLCMIVLSLLAFFALAYFAITLSHTLLHDKKWRGLVAFVVFIALNLIVSKVQGLLPNPVDYLVINATTVAGTQELAVQGPWDIIPYLAMYAGLDLAIFLLSSFSCGWMLEKKVSL